jgi:sulfofructose kinase
MTEKRIIAVGHAALDYVYKIDKFPHAPTKLRAIEHIASGGGMAANAAATIAKLGGKVSLWSRIGNDDAGAIVVQQLRRIGVDTKNVRAFNTSRSPTAAVIVDSRGERLIVSEDDHNLPLSADWLPAQDIEAASVVFSDLTWLEGTRLVFGTAHKLGIPTVLDIDLGSGMLLSKIIGLTDYAIFSAPAFRQFVHGHDDHARLTHLIESGVQHAGVTLGAKGYAWMNHEGKTGEQAAFGIEAVDSTGAGDAFHGAFTWALAKSYDETECARIAAAAAALSCRRLGARAGRPAKSELEEFIRTQFQES